MSKTQRLFAAAAYLQALIATLGSLYFSEIMKFTPCVLCWYQRILMYPLVLLITVGILRKDAKMHLYILPLSIIGWFIAAYHNLIYYHIISENFVPCTNGVSCTTKFFAWFGFITIPLMSLTAFTIINILMFLFAKTRSPESHQHPQAN